jgi:hypothetical protein
MARPDDPSTTPIGASAPRSGLRRIAPGVALVALVIVGALAGWLFVSSESALSLPPERSVSWVLYDGFGPATFDSSTAATTTSVTVRVGVPVCIYWNKSFPRGDTSWLAPPTVTYTPSAVTITVQTNDAFDAVKECGGTVNGRRSIGVVLDVYVSVRVQLSEPLGGRALFDGSTSPPAARPYKTP